MISNQIEKFEEFLANSFGDGTFTRELRLSSEEVEMVRKKYPKASIQKCFQTDAPDGKCWYEISLITPIVAMEKSGELQMENHRLKREIELLKRSLTKLA